MGRWRLPLPRTRLGASAECDSSFAPATAACSLPRTRRNRPRIRPPTPPRSPWPACATTIIAFQIAANDLAGHAALLSGDPKEVVQVDRDAPQFSEVVIVTAPDLTVNGRDFYDGGATPLQVNATVTDGGAGVDAASICLRIAGET